MKYHSTIVSGHWFVKNKNGNNFYEWFKNTLSIKAPYIFFGNEESIKIVKEIRDLNEYPTHYVNIEIDEFYCYKYKDNIMTHDIHCISQEVTMIWNEKVFFVKKAKDINPFNSEYFFWIDSGIYTFRNNPPPNKSFPDLEKVSQLPKDKFIFTSSDSEIFLPHYVNDNHYYHYISGNFMMNIEIIDKFVEIYKKYIDKYLSKKNWIYTDQVIFTFIYNDKPELFYHLTHGYGKILTMLY